MIFGAGDLVSIFGALAFLAIGCSQASNRTSEQICILLANGLVFGSMALILLSPLSQVRGFSANLSELAVKEEKLTLWWAAAVAGINLVRMLL